MTDTQGENYRTCFCGANGLYLGDCLEAMRGIEDGSVDLILCDLPYGVLNKRNVGARFDRVIPFAPLWEQYERVIKERGAIVLFGQGMFTARLMMSNPRLWRYNLIWCKCNGVTGFLNANRMPMRNHEDICVFYKKLPKYNPQFTQGEKNHARGGACNGYKASGNAQNRCYGGFKNTPTTFTTNKYPKSVVYFDKQKNFYPPTEKPVDLLAYLIRTYTDEGDVVLDNTMGSGSTCVACVKTGRRYIGIEKEEKYYEIACERVREAEAELANDMFGV